MPPLVILRNIVASMNVTDISAWLQSPYLAKALLEAGLLLFKPWVKRQISREYANVWECVKMYRNKNLREERELRLAILLHNDMYISRVSVKEERKTRPNRTPFLWVHVSLFIHSSIDQRRSAYFRAYLQFCWLRFLSHLNTKLFFSSNSNFKVERILEQAHMHMCTHIQIHIHIWYLLVLVR